MTKTLEWLTRWPSTTFNSTFPHYDRPKPQNFRKTTEIAIQRMTGLVSEIRRLFPHKFYS
jgi:hypothetical protein